MAYGACGGCGCAFEECECKGRRPRRTTKTKKPKIVASPGDWVRVRRGHELEGAAGQIRKIVRKTKPALVTFRQLNGNEVRLPLGLLEFVSYANNEPDVL